MKLMVFCIALLAFASCGHRPNLQNKSHLELTDEVMNASFLNLAIKSAVTTTSNCIEPLAGSVPESVFNQIVEILGKNFKLEEVQRSIRYKLYTGIEKQEMLELAQMLNDKTWRKFVSGVENTNSENYAKDFSRLDQGLNQNTFDLKSPRSVLVAKITDHSFMLNLLKKSHDQVRKMLSGGEKQPTAKQKRLINWANQELSALEYEHIKRMFLSTYLATEDFSNEELEELFKIRNSDIFRKGRMALEDEISDRYEKFFKDLKTFNAPL